MKKFLFGFIMLFSFLSFFQISAEDCTGCPTEHLKRCYFQPSQLLIDQETVYVLIDDHLIPFNCAGRDDQGYYLTMWDDNDFCPFCSNWTWSNAFNCCLNPPTICKASCQSKYKKN